MASKKRVKMSLNSSEVEEITRKGREESLLSWDHSIMTNFQTIIVDYFHPQHSSIFLFVK